MSKDFTLTDNFNDQLIVKDMTSVESTIQLEIFNQGTNVSNDFNLTLEDAARLIAELQDIIDCNTAGV